MCESNEDVPDVGNLPVFSGHCPACRKCGLPEGKAVGTKRTYRRSGGTEWLERTCGACGYTWPERCADADSEPCEKCGGHTGGKECEECTERKWLRP